MTHFAPVSPLSGLRRLAKTPEALGTYQLLIAPIILHDKKGYRRFFLEEQEGRQHVIVDNGVIEQGESVDIEDIYEAAHTVGAQLIVLPDTIDDGYATARQAERYLPALRRLDSSMDTMGVVQGTTFEECLECAEKLVSLGVDWLGVPRGLTKNLKSRVPLVITLSDEHGLPMHVLGFSDNIADDLMAAACHRLVRGMDAATPGWAPQRLPVRPPEDSRYLGRRPKDFWLSQLAVHAEENILTVRRWLNAAQTARTDEDELAGLMGSPRPL